jgi:hypothetical protein
MCMCAALGIAKGPHVDIDKLTSLSVGTIGGTQDSTQQDWCQEGAWQILSDAAGAAVHALCVMHLPRICLLIHAHVQTYSIGTKAVFVPTAGETTFPDDPMTSRARVGVHVSADVV